MDELEYASHPEAKFPLGGGWTAQPPGASEWLPEEVETVCSKALFVTFGVVVDHFTVEAIESRRSRR